MKNLNRAWLKVFTIFSFLCLLVPVVIYVLWIYAFELGATQAERVMIFKDFSPNFLNGRWDITLLSIAFCVLAIIFIVKFILNDVKTVV